MMDGMVLVNLANHLTNTTYADAKERSNNAEDGPSEVKDIFAGVAEKIDDAVLSPLVDQGKLVIHLFSDLFAIASKRILFIQQQRNLTA